MLPRLPAPAWIRRWLPLAFGLGLLRALALPAFSQDSLISGAEHRGSLATPGQRDTWTFSAQAGEFFLLRLGKIRAEDSLQPRFAVLDPEGRFLFGDQSATSVGIAQPVPVSGRHTVVVDSLENGTGEYRLSLGLGHGSKEPVVPPGDQGGPLPNGAAILGTISPGDLDVWTFSAKAGELFLVRLGKTNPADTFVPRFHLLDPDGRFVTGGLQASSAGTVGEAGVAGRYTVIVDSWGYGDGDYRLSLAQGSIPPVVTPGDEGGPLPNGELVRGNIAPGDLDVWSFEARAGQHIFLEVGRVSDADSLKPILQVCDSEGRLMERAGNATNWARIVFDAPRSERYTVSVRGEVDGEGFYGIGGYRLSCGRGGETVVASPDDEGGGLPGLPSVEGSLAPGDFDVWSFAACTGNVLRLASERLSGPADFVPSFSLLDPSGRRIYLGAPGPAPDSLRAPTNGVYSLLVYGYTTNTANPSGSYRLHADGLRLAPRLGLRQSREGATTLDGAGGTPLAPVRILASPDALLPSSAWKPVADTRYDEGGSFSQPWIRPKTLSFSPYFLRAVSP